MHMLIWLKGVLLPQEIRDKIMNPTSDFQQRIVEYPLCKNKACDEENCDNCQELETWWQKFRKITNDLIFKSNVYTCRGQSNEKASKKDRPGCIKIH